jgi:hypothetical protein
LHIGQAGLVHCPAGDINTQPQLQRSNPRLLDDLCPTSGVGNSVAESMQYQTFINRDLRITPEQRQMPVAGFLTGRISHPAMAPASPTINRQGGQPHSVIER